MRRQVNVDRARIASSDLLEYHIALCTVWKPKGQAFAPKIILMRFIRSALLLTLCALLLSGCFLRPFKIDVQQGNFIDQEAVSKLKPEMTRSQVRFLLGTPLITDPFHPERWDYYYVDRKGGKVKASQRLTLYFDGDKLKRAMSSTAGSSSLLDGKQSAAVTDKP